MTDALRDRPYHHGNLAAAAIAAAEVEIARHGIADASLRKVADRAGVSHTAVGKRFGDKAGLLAAVAAEGYRVLGEGLGAVAGDMRAMGRAYVEFAVQRPALFSVMFQPTVYRADDPGVVAARARRPPHSCGGASASAPTAPPAPPPSGRGRSSTGSPRSCSAARSRAMPSSCTSARRRRCSPPVRRPCDRVCAIGTGGRRRAFPVSSRESWVAGMDRPPCRRPSGVLGTGIVRIRMTTAAARPLIGLTGRRKLGAQVAGFPDSFADVALDLYVSAYAEAVTSAGGLPVHLPQHVDPAEYAGHLDGVLLSGGADVDPVRYGAVADPATGPVERERDAAELALLELAVAEELPVLGICRGLQVLNVWAGGTLHQDQPAHARYDLRVDDAFDEVTVEPGSRLAALHGEQVRVNSLHHQRWSASPTA